MLAIQPLMRSRCPAYPLLAHRRSARLLLQGRLPCADERDTGADCPRRPECRRHPRAHRGGCGRLRRGVDGHRGHAVGGADVRPQCADCEHRLAPWRWHRAGGDCLPRMAPSPSRVSKASTA
eukprot:1106583-Prymnesium_polylepis.2